MRSARAILSRLAYAQTRGWGGGTASEGAATASLASSMPSPPSSTSTPSSFFSTLSSSPPSFAEIRQYTLHPSRTGDFIAATAATVHLRQQLPFLAMLQCEVGDLNTVTHFYLYGGESGKGGGGGKGGGRGGGGLGERDALRAALAAQKEWTADYLPVSRACVASQTSMLVQVEAEVAAKARELALAAEGGGGKEKAPGVFDFIAAPPPHSPAASSAADNDTSRVSARALASERHGGVLALRGRVVAGTGGPGVSVGAHVEVWRFADAAAAVSGRSAADAPAAGVSRQLLKPLPFSPWQ